MIGVIAGLAAQVSGIFAARETRKAEEARTEGLYADLLAGYTNGAQEQEKALTMIFAAVIALSLVIIVSKR